MCLMQHSPIASVDPGQSFVPTMETLTIAINVDNCHLLFCGCTSCYYCNEETEEIAMFLYFFYAQHRVLLICLACLWQSKVSHHFSEIPLFLQLPRNGKYGKHCDILQLMIKKALLARSESSLGLISDLQPVLLITAAAEMATLWNWWHLKHFNAENYIWQPFHSGDVRYLYLQRYPM